MRHFFLFIATLFFVQLLFAQPIKKGNPSLPVVANAGKDSVWQQLTKPLRWRNIGPFRGGRSVTACGVRGNAQVYYMGTTGGGVWKTEDAGSTWENVSDGFFKTGSVGAVAVAPSDANVIYVGMGEHAPRGVMTSYGDGVYKSTDGGRTWQHIGLSNSRHIAWIRIDPKQPDIVFVAVQGALYGPSIERGVFKSVDGGKNWKKVLYVDENTGCADLDIDPSNPRLLYAAMWDHGRKPWEMRSGGKGSGLYRSTDGGETWQPITKGIPGKLGKMSIAVSGADGKKVYALIESDTQTEDGGLFVSDNAGLSFTRVSKDHRLTQRAWYYIEVFADPKDANTVYVLNSPGLVSYDGGKSWSYLRGTHGDYHQLWINPDNNKNMIIANDGGAAISFNGGKSWSTQDNQPTAQMYRINADNLFPYNIYGGQQDNSSVKIASRNVSDYGYSISNKEWSYSAGGESAFIAFDPNDPNLLFGGSYQGTIGFQNLSSQDSKMTMIAPIQYQALAPKEMKYRFNWNAPIIHSIHEKGTFYHAGNKLFRTSNLGKSWQVVSPDLTRNDTTHQGLSGVPYTNEGAGGENYGTIAYVQESPIEKGVFYTGSDDGFVFLTKDNAKSWQNVTPAGLAECLVNCIEVSPHQPATAYIATTRYKFNDLKPGIYKTNDYGKTWVGINNGIPDGAYTRVVREDPEVKGLLYCGTETGFYVSANDGASWQMLQMGLPIVPITDLKVHQGDLIASTAGRSFWVLDDLNVLRQTILRQLPLSNKLYTPRNIYRVSGGSQLDQSFDTESNKPLPALYEGTNPSTGVVFHYFLREAVSDSSMMLLEILDEKGGLVRKYSSKSSDDFESYPGGPEPDPTLPTNKGMNRFVWNTRYASIPGVPKVYIEGSYDGHKAAPGVYSARFTFFDSIVQTISFRILPHPALKYSIEEYAEQHIWQQKVESDVITIHQAVLDTRKVRHQLDAFAHLLKDKTSSDSIKDAAEALSKALLDWENEVVQNKAESNDDIINYVNKISADYIFLKGEMDANIPFVTDGQKEQYHFLHTQWTTLDEKRKKILEKVAAFNRLCKLQEIDKIVIPQ